VYLVSLLNNVLNFMDISSHYQLVVQRGDRHRGGLCIHQWKAPSREVCIMSTVFDASTAIASPDGLAAGLAAMLRNNRSAFAILALVALTAVAVPSLFKPDNLLNIALQFAPLGIVVVGQTFVIMVRGLDLSVGSVMSTAAVIATAFSGTNADLPWILLLAIAMGALVGAINGLLVTKRNVSPFLATLATMIVLQGVRGAWTQGAPSGNVPPFLRTLGAGTSAGIPNNVVILLAVAGLAYALLHLASFGRRVYIVGEGRNAARLVGIDVDRVSMVAYVLSGIFAAIAGLVLCGYSGVVDNWVGKNYELDSIVAAVMAALHCPVAKVALQELCSAPPSSSCFPTQS